MKGHESSTETSGEIVVIAPNDEDQSNKLGVDLRPNSTLREITTLLLFLLILIYMIVPNSKDIPDFLMAPFVVLFILCICVTYYFRWWKKRAQLRLNEAVSVDHLPTFDFILYLRPFTTSGRVLVENNLEKAADRLLMGLFWDIELALSVAMDERMPLVALGHVGRATGAAKITTDDANWQDVFMRCAERAKLILVIPFSRPSTLWEIEQITARQDLIGKTVFVMPPSRLLPYRLSGLWRKTVRRRWRAAQKALAPSGIELPPYRRAGRFFMIASDRTKLAEFPIANLELDYVSELLVNISKIQDERDDEDRNPFDPTALTPRIPKKSWIRRTYNSRRFLQSSWYGVIAMLLALTFRTFLFEPFNIPSASMMPTLLVGDYLFVSKYSYLLGEPKRGDVAVFKLPTDNETDYIKRIIGLPGDRIQVRRGRLWINGEEVRRERVEDFVFTSYDGRLTRVAQFVETLPNGRRHRILEMSDSGPLDNTQIYTVPEGHYFAMGENRDNSADSRLLNHVGFVPAENMVGPATMFFFSNDGSAAWWEFWRWLGAVRFDRIFDAIE